MVIPLPSAVSRARHGPLAPVPPRSRSHKGGYSGAISLALYHPLRHRKRTSPFENVKFTRLYHTPSIIPSPLPPPPPRVSASARLVVKPERRAWSGITQSVGEDRRSAARRPPTFPLGRGWTRGSRGHCAWWMLAIFRVPGIFTRPPSEVAESHGLTWIRSPCCSHYEGSLPGPPCYPSSRFPLASRTS